jgi:hypothetical protein
LTIARNLTSVRLQSSTSSGRRYDCNQLESWLLDHSTPLQSGCGRRLRPKRRYDRNQLESWLLERNLTSVRLRSSTSSGRRNDRNQLESWLPERNLTSVRSRSSTSFWTALRPQPA